ncbi:MAG: OmpA family protein [Gammaproteobacteria bacterium]|nr:MAG: OmpA family protein [Gammaproteobacteria bacterium]
MTFNSTRLLYNRGNFIRETIMKKSLVGLMVSLCFLVSCTYNPFIGDNHTTGSAAGVAVGAAAGAGGVAALGGSKFAMMLGGLTGGMLGYYATTLRYDSGGIIQGGGDVYTVGDYIGIYIPSDRLFYPNTADFTPQAPSILDSVGVILQRKPNNNILISGNTSGFSRPRWELRLSEERAKKVAAYLWNTTDISQFKENSINLRRLKYVGYGDYFPIATHETNAGIRKNSRIQITSYPTGCDLDLDLKHEKINNYGSSD